MTKRFINILLNIGYVFVLFSKGAKKSMNPSIITNNVSWPPITYSKSNKEIAECVTLKSPLKKTPKYKNNFKMCSRYEIQTCIIRDQGVKYGYFKA